jgi:ribosomal 30S subunit maturation factor RimM
MAVPEDNDTYMTYGQWWKEDSVPEAIRQKSIREQEEWRAVHALEVSQARAKARQAKFNEALKKERERLEKAADDDFYKGACIGGSACFVVLKGLACIGAL